MLHVGRPPITITLAITITVVIIAIPAHVLNMRG
jgi:hypothetical protein